VSIASLPMKTAAARHPQKGQELGRRNRPVAPVQERLAPGQRMQSASRHWVDATVLPIDPLGRNAGERRGYRGGSPCGDRPGGH
jgi:hypothetical protein